MSRWRDWLNDRVLFFLLWLALSLFGFHLWRFTKTPFLIRHALTYYVKPKATVYHLVADLLEKGILRHPRLFLILAYLKNTANTLQAGEYSLEVGITPGQFLDRIKAGKIKLYRFTLIEGWTYRQLLVALQQDQRFKNKIDNAFLASLRPPQLGCPTSSLEGLFFAESYDFPKNVSNTEILRKAFQLMQEQLLIAWGKRAPNLPWKHPYEALIAASLIEKEAALPDERAKIAGVIIRRLKKDMPLQIDASIIYGLGKRYSGQLRMHELKLDTPYNTYTRHGLPPTPIAIPSLGSIQAALHPDLTSSYLYFVAIGNGRHVFSEKLAEHQKAVARYRRQMHTRRTLVNKHKLRV